MKCRKIQFREVDDVRRFVDAASNCPFDVDIQQGRLIANAKSILGVFNLDIKNTMTIRYDGCCERFEEIVNQFQPA